MSELELRRPEGAGVAGGRVTAHADRAAAVSTVDRAAGRTTVQPRAALSRARAGLALAMLGAVVALPAAAAAELQRCRAIADERSRLACFDALADAAASRPGLSPGRASDRAPVAGQPGAVPPSGSVTQQPAPASAATAPAATPPPADATAAFGLAARNVDGGLRELRSQIPGRVTGWGPNSRFRLANGQVWQVSDGSSAVILLQDPGVRIRRGAISGYVMEIEGLNRAPRVRRVE